MCMQKPRRERKKPSPDAIVMDEIYKLGCKILRPEARCLYFILYLSAARVSEALNMRCKDIQFRYDKG